nr:glutathione S-transferase family protein [uncultured Cohaesibacter sp.]
MGIKLYDLCGQNRDLRFSPACWRTRMALAHKGLEVETIPTLFTEIGEIEGGGQTTVPVLKDGDRVIRDSFDIALYLEETYPDLPSLFQGEGGKKTSCFIDRWSNMVVNRQLIRLCILDIYNGLDEKDKPYFRQSRETRFGMPLEEIEDRSAPRIEAFRDSFAPFREALKAQTFIGGEAPLYADYCIFGSLQWGRMVSDFTFFEENDPVCQWFECCLDLFDGLGRNAKV